MGFEIQKFVDLLTALEKITFIQIWIQIYLGIVWNLLIALYLSVTFYSNAISG